MQKQENNSTTFCILIYNTEKKYDEHWVVLSLLAVGTIALPRLKSYVI